MKPGVIAPAVFKRCVEAIRDVPHSDAPAIAIAVGTERRIERNPDIVEFRPERHLLRLFHAVGDVK